MKRAIWNLRSGKSQPPVFCFVEIEGGNVILEVKQGKDKYETISWEDMVYQINAALKEVEEQ